MCAQVNTGNLLRRSWTYEPDEKIGEIDFIVSIWKSRWKPATDNLERKHQEIVGEERLALLE
jgi:hypothetical protein